MPRLTDAGKEAIEEWCPLEEPPKPPKPTSSFDGDEWGDGICPFCKTSNWYTPQADFYVDADGYGYWTCPTCKTLLQEDSRQNWHRSVEGLIMESTLSIKKADLEGDVGYFLGFGRGADNGDTAWDKSTTAIIQGCVRSGLRRFYNAATTDTADSYDWSFLRPLVTLVLLQGNNRIQLPDDYFGMEGRVAVTTPQSAVYQPFPIVGVGMVQNEYSRTPQMTGWPRMAAIQPIKGSTGSKGQRFELYVFPTADQYYQVQFIYHVSPDALTDERPYPYGGMMHGETILESCLAVAEQRYDDMQGVHTSKYAELLATSIAVDRRNKPQLMGYCGDRSDNNYGWGNPRREIYDGEFITFNGQQY